MKRPVKKVKRFSEGGFSEAQEKWLGGADRTDPAILARMRSAVPDEPKAEPKEETKPTVIESSEETGNKSTTAPKAVTPKPAAPKAENNVVAKTKEKTEPKVNGKTFSETIVASKSKNQDAPKEVKKEIKNEPVVTKEKSFVEKVADIKAKEAKAKDPYSGDDNFSRQVREAKEKDKQKEIDKKKAALESSKNADEKFNGPMSLFNKKVDAKKKGGKVKTFKSGGTVKRSSASSRGDGCAVKGHTRGRYV
jgi:hypothetical protein